MSIRYCFDCDRYWDMDKEMVCAGCDGDDDPTEDQLERYYDTAGPSSAERREHDYKELKETGRR